jgi:5-formyltetrahydrofolate cyclo-ligase
VNRQPKDAITEAKARLRKELRARLKTVPEAERAASSAAVCQRVLTLPFWPTASFILFYAALPVELDLTPVIQAALAAGKTVALPWYDPQADAYFPRRIRDWHRDLAVGYYHILEPSEAAELIPLNQLDLTLVPGLGFSVAGARLGRGKGYYDRLLASSSGIKCGVGYDWQVGLAIPVELHDVGLNCILTPSRWLECCPRGR